MEFEIRKQIEESVRNEMQNIRNDLINYKQVNKLWYRNRSMQNNSIGINDEPKKVYYKDINNEIVCYKCGQAGHVARGCMKRNEGYNVNKKDKNAYLNFYGNCKNIYIKKMNNDNITYIQNCKNIKRLN
ncbi:hypothetical protein GVAV_000488 [Gurleya vavrai]